MLDVSTGQQQPQVKQCTAAPWRAEPIVLTAPEGLLTPTLYHDPTAEGVGTRIIWFRDTDIRAHIQHRFGGGYAALVRYEDLEIHEDFDPGELETALAWIRDGLDWVYEQIQEPEC